MNDNVLWLVIGMFSVGFFCGTTFGMYIISRELRIQAKIDKEKRSHRYVASKG